MWDTQGEWFIELEQEIKEEESLRGYQEEGRETAWQWNSLILNSSPNGRIKLNW